MKKITALSCIAIAIMMGGCITPLDRGASKILRSWDTDSYSYKCLVNAVESRSGSKVAVLDFDGTVFCERDKTYFDWWIAARYIQEHGSKFTEYEKNIAELVIEKGVIPEWGTEDSALSYRAWKGVMLYDYCDYVRKYLEEPMPGFNNLKRKDALFKPMLEVIDYLQSRGFKVFICTGTDRWLARIVLDGHVPSENIIGSDFRYDVCEDGCIRNTGEVLEKNLNEQKIVHIWEEIGCRPSIIFGNSSGDYEMERGMIPYEISFAHGWFPKEHGRYRAYCPVFMVMCDDTVRDVGDIDEAESVHTQCLKNGWVPISMKDDWKTIYGGTARKRR